MTLPARAGRRPGRVVGRFGALLAAIVVSIAFAMAAPSGELGLLAALALQAAVLLLALRVAAAPARLRRNAAIAAAGVVVVGLVADVVDVGPGTAVVAVLSLLLVSAAILAIVSRLVADADVGAETVLAALCIYLLIGTFFAFAFSAVAVIGDGDLFTDGVDADLATLHYFSLTTLTTVGYGDLSPATGPGRSLAMVEALFGQVYLVTVVALLVGNLQLPGAAGRRRRDLDDPGDDELSGRPG